MVSKNCSTLCPHTEILKFWNISVLEELCCQTRPNLLHISANEKLDNLLHIASKIVKALH
jgi:hypothetical protein